VRRLAGTTDGVHIAVNAFLLKLQGRWALIDAGAGNSMGPTLGKLPEHLRAFGVAPEEIAAVFLTHIHPDHSNGLVDDAGRAVFPNAELILHEAEARFWLDREQASGETERIRRNIARAAVATAPYRSRMRPVREGEAMAGISAVALPGHTPGHTGWLLASGKASLLIWGDLVHLASVQVARPDIEFLMSWVVARKLAVLTTAEGPNRIPSRLMRKARPFAVSVPRISEGPSPPVTRLSTTDELPG
jgi:glyoxylase-like metal-dependent hydrolase (beta-lactamase superfamily II)